MYSHYTQIGKTLGNDEHVADYCFQMLDVGK